MNSKMKNIRKIAVYFITPIFFILFNENINAQGCSDAGVCSLDMMNHKGDDGNEEKKIPNSNHLLKFGASYGLADYKINVLQSYLEYGYQTENFKFNIKTNIMSQMGTEASSFGLGDIILSGQYRVMEETFVSLGLKAPLNNSNTQYEFNSNKFDLPMDYQTSLGTYDLILGVSHQIDNWGFFTAYQLPLKQNDNGFISNLQNSNPIFREFATTNQYERAADLIARISYNYQINEELNIIPSILPIYHLQNDKSMKLNGDAIGFEEIIGSQGLTLNLNMNLNFKFKDDVISFNLGFPVMVRDTRPDGLTRAFVSSLDYTFRF